MFFFSFYYQDKSFHEYLYSDAVQVIAESLSEEEIAGLKEMFKAMDTDNSGAITFDELKAGLRRYGSTLKDTEIRDLMEAVSTLNPDLCISLKISMLKKNLCANLPGRY